MGRYDFLTDGSFKFASLDHRWTFPEVVSFDSQTSCNLHCEYCHPHTLKPDLFPNKQLPLNDIRLILEQIGRTRMYDIRPYQNGEALLESRLPDILNLIHQLTKAPVTVYTNGTIYRNRHLLRHPRLSTVFFTISAATRGTYRKVHGVDLFDKALATLDWLTRHKYPEQEIVLTLVVTRNNIDEIPAWHERFKNYPRLVAPLHTGYKGASSLDCLRGLDLAEITQKYGTYKGFMFGMPCPCWNELMVSVDGQYLICTIATPDAALGDIHKVTMQEAWNRKMKLGMDNPLCNACNMRSPKWRQIYETNWLREVKPIALPS
jgi:MoaA/NifB/PqqE/SkfB family radical SAM enzyme